MFKICDILELYIFCLEETQLGNRHGAITTILTNCTDIFNSFNLKEKYPEIQELINDLKEDGLGGINEPRIYKNGLR